MAKYPQNPKRGESFIDGNIIYVWDGYSWRRGFFGGTGGSGTSGTSGTSGGGSGGGTSGTSGSSGTSGASGTSGTSGASGTSGSSGTSGTSGASGTSGTSGTSGIGSTGPTGPSEQVISLYIDSTPDDISLGIKANRIIAGPSEIKEWYIIAQETGDIEFDIKKGQFSLYPVTSSITGGNYPSLSNQNKNSGSPSWLNLYTNDVLEYEVRSCNGIKKVELHIKIKSI